MRVSAHGRHRFSRRTRRAARIISVAVGLVFGIDRIADVVVTDSIGILTGAAGVGVQQGTCGVLTKAVDSETEGLLRIAEKADCIAAKS